MPQTYDLPTPYQQFIYKSRYARYLQDEGRRENWEETVNRYLNFFEDHLKDNYEFSISEEMRNDIFGAIEIGRAHV